jgi:hypothetical protein
MDICSICLEPSKNKLECSHTNCVECLKILVKKQSICPICRQEFNTNPYKYSPPRFKPTLKLATKQKRMMNKFLLNRYKMRNCKKEKKTFYSNLMFQYTGRLFLSSYDHRYIDPIEINLYNKSKALKLYKYINLPYCYFSKSVKDAYIEMIEQYLLYE